MSRGNERRDIVEDDDDRRLFIELLGKMSARHDIEIYAYVLMDNHYHLLLRTPRGNLSRCMQWFSITYTRRYNVRHKRSGHLFQGRFKSFLIEDDAYLLRLSCYIHRNPLRAGLANRLVDYRWSTYPVYAYGRKSPEWLNTELILSLLHCRDKNTAYKNAVQQYAKENRRIWEEVKYGLIMGGKEYLEEITRRFLSDSNDGNDEMPQKKQVLKEQNPAEILTRAAHILKCDVDEITNGQRVKESIKENRDLLIYLLWDMGLYTNSEIGVLFSLTYSAISRRVNIMQAKIDEGRRLKRKYNKLKSQIKTRPH